MSRSIHTQVPVVIVSLVVGMGSAMAQNPSPPDPTAPSKETREKMATFHERIASCLRSDKPIAECRAEMMKNFGRIPGETGCPMMGSGMHGPMMQDESAPSRTAPPPGTPK
jgi:hypothetical protein